MAMHYYLKTLPDARTDFNCSGCGAVTAYYRSPAALFYGI